ncbi:MAG: acyl-CoA dehydrogenase [Myxococcales bacterium]|nr:acyl-CoA dehydrogenase [Myxococcales bacterium]
MAIDFALGADEARICGVARTLASGVLARHAVATDRGAFPRDNLKALGHAGLLGVKLPAGFGGLAGGNVAYCAAVFEVARVCPSTAVTMAVTNMVADMIWHYGTPAQHARWLRPLVTGHFTAGAFALSEPGAGSDAASLRTRAETADLDGVVGWRLTGQKQWITSGDVAGVVLVMAKTDATVGARGITAFLVDPAARGFSVGRHEDKLGLRGSSTVGLDLDGVFVPDSERLGALGQGFAVAMTALDGGRCGIGAQALGMGRAALEAATRHVAARRDIWRELGTEQNVQFRLADIATRLEAGWLLVQRAAWLRDQGRKMTTQAAMAKVFATEAAGFAARTAVELIGPAALDRHSVAARALRDVRVARIYEGTSEVQRLVIARSLAVGR